MPKTLIFVTFARKDVVEESECYQDVRKEIRVRAIVDWRKVKELSLD